MRNTFDGLTKFVYDFPPEKAIAISNSGQMLVFVCPIPPLTGSLFKQILKYP